MVSEDGKQRKKKKRKKGSETNSHTNRDRYQNFWDFQLGTFSVRDWDFFRYGLGFLRLFFQPYLMCHPLHTPSQYILGPNQASSSPKSTIIFQFSIQFLVRLPLLFPMMLNIRVIPSFPLS